MFSVLTEHCSKGFAQLRWAARYQFSFPGGTKYACMSRLRRKL